MKTFNVYIGAAVIFACAAGQAVAATSSYSPPTYTPSSGPPTYQPKLERAEPPKTYQPKVERPQPPQTYQPSGPTFRTR